MDELALLALVVAVTWLAIIIVLGLFLLLVAVINPFALSEPVFKQAAAILIDILLMLAVVIIVVLVLEALLKRIGVE